MSFRLYFWISSLFLSSSSELCFSPRSIEDSSLYSSNLRLFSSNSLLASSSSDSLLSLSFLSSDNLLSKSFFSFFKSVTSSLKLSTLSPFAEVSE